MPCYSPISAYRSETPNQSGKFPLIFNPGKKSGSLAPQEIPCGQCIGCRLERSRQWALRISHEASLHAQNTFITLTFNPESLPADRSISVRTWQLFLKKLRKHVHPQKIRFFACGEYGEDPTSYNGIGRPHYHAIIFGYDFPDRVVHSVNAAGDVIYTSKILSDIWGYGFVTVGNVTFESAAYVARYVTKKINGERAADHYQTLDPLTGELKPLVPEFALMSRRPGIGRAWFDLYESDLHKGFITSRGIKMQPPKFYDNLLDKSQPFLMDEIKQQRKLSQLENFADNTQDRLDVKHAIKKRKLKTLKRSLD